MNQKINREFRRYAIPTVAAMLVNGLYQVIDGIFIGRYLGSEGLAAINLAWPVIAVILGVGMMIGVGTGALASVKQGQKKLTESKDILATGLILLVILMPFIAIILYFFSSLFLEWQGAENQALIYGQDYLDILIYSSVFTLGSVALPFLLRNDQSPKIATGLMVVGAVLNIIFDYLFIAVLDWELTGAALATAGAQFAVTIAGVGYFFSNKAQMRLAWFDLKLHPQYITQIIWIGTSSFFMYVYAALMVAIHNAYFSLYGGLVYVGAFAIVGYIVTAYYLIAEGIANGMQPLVSYYYGARHARNMLQLFKIALISALVIGILFTLALNVFPEPIIYSFNAQDEALIQTSIEGIHLHLFALCLDGFLVVTAAFYQAIHKGKKATVIMVSNLLIQLPFLWVLPAYFSVQGVWLAYPLSNIVLSVIVLYFLIKDLKPIQEAAKKPKSLS